MSKKMFILSIVLHTALVVVGVVIMSGCDRAIQEIMNPPVVDMEPATVAEEPNTPPTEVTIEYPESHSVDINMLDSMDVGGTTISIGFNEDGYDMDFRWHRGVNLDSDPPEYSMWVVSGYHARIVKVKYELDDNMRQIENTTIVGDYEEEFPIIFTISAVSATIIAKVFFEDGEQFTVTANYRHE